MDRTKKDIEVLDAIKEIEKAYPPSEARAGDKFNEPWQPLEELLEKGLNKE